MTYTAHTLKKTSKKAPTTDFYQYALLLTDEEQSVCERIRAFCDQEVLPVIGGYWERGEVPFELLSKLAALNVVGDSIQGYNCPGLKKTTAGMVCAELSRGDGGLNAIISVSNLAMYAIEQYGSEEQKQQWLPALAKLEKIGAFAATEPNHGSDALHLEASARREGDQWVLNGTKRWITNGSFADLVIIWARTYTGQVNAFLVEKGTPGFEAQVITGKNSLRSSWQADITLRDVRIPASHRLPLSRSFNDAQKILTIGRYKVAWSALGHAMSCYEQALSYTKKRKQFNKPLASFQLVQYKLARMLAEITALQALCYRLGQLFDKGQATAAMVSLAKMQATQKARIIAADACELLGGNGILLENQVIKHLVDIESYFTLEGTNHIQALTVGLDVTGTQAFF